MSTVCRHCTGCWVCTEMSTEHLLCAGTVLSVHRDPALILVGEKLLSRRDHVLCCGGVTNPDPEMDPEQELLDFGSWEFGEPCSFHREDDRGPGEGRLCLTSWIQVFLHLSSETQDNHCDRAAPFLTPRLHGNCPTSTLITTPGG